MKCRRRAALQHKPWLQHMPHLASLVRLEAPPPTPSATHPACHAHMNPDWAPIPH